MSFHFFKMSEDACSVKIVPPTIAYSLPARVSIAPFWSYASYYSVIYSHLTAAHVFAVVFYFAHTLQFQWELWGLSAYLFAYTMQLQHVLRETKTVEQWKRWLISLRIWEAIRFLIALGISLAVQITANYSDIYGMICLWWASMFPLSQFIMSFYVYQNL